MEIVEYLRKVREADDLTTLLTSEASPFIHRCSGVYITPLIDQLQIGVYVDITLPRTAYACTIGYKGNIVRNVRYSVTSLRHFIYQTLDHILEFHGETHVPLITE